MEDDGEKQPFPEHLSNYEIHDLIVASAAEHWGRYELTDHTIEIPA